MSEKEGHLQGDLLEMCVMQKWLEEEARRYLHLAIRLRASDLAEARRGGEGCSCSNCSYRESSAWRLKISMVDDVESVHTELEIQGFMYFEVLRDRGIEIHFARCTDRVA